MRRFTRRHRHKRIRTERLAINMEFCIPSPEESLEQGDILLSRDLKTGQVRDLVLLVTADCDIAQNKFGTHLACLRIIGLQEYIKTIWAEKKLRRAVEKESVTAQSILNKWNKRRSEESEPLSVEAVLQWLKASEPGSICKDLEIPEIERTKVEKLLSTYRKAFLAADDTANDHFCRLVSFKALLANKLSEDVIPSVLKDAQPESLPDDVFVLPGLPQLNVGPSVILLRELLAIKAESVRLRASEAISPDMWLRIGRLEPTFKYAISQAFGTLYSRIGLPELYESRRQKAFETLPDLNWNP